MNLTPEIIRETKAFHARNQKRLLALPVWDMRDFDDLFFSFFEIDDNATSLDEAVISVASIEFLAFDPRTPPHEAAKMAELLTRARDAGALK